jgi:D-amino peptidase
MTAEVNAAVAGAFEGGAAAVVVNDAHGSHQNLIQTELDPRVTLIRGDLKPYGMMQGLEESFTGVVFIGYHGRAGSEGSFAAHTGSGKVADLRVNGRAVGEGGMNTLYAAWYGVPVIFVSGDRMAVRQVREIATGTRGVAVKEGIWNRAVVTLSPDSARAAIRRGVAEAVRAQVPTPTRPAGPFEVELQFARALSADVAEGLVGVSRTGPRTVRFTAADYPAAYRMIRVLYKHLSP